MAYIEEGSSRADFFEGTSGVDSLNGRGGDDTIPGYGGNDTLYGGDGNDSIDGGTGKDRLYGDDGDDTLIGGKGNDILTGGEGEDYFVYTLGDGNDTILDYNAEDTVEITSGTISEFTKKDNNVIFTLSDGGKITFKDVGDKTITYIENGETKIYPKIYDTNAKGTSVTLLPEYSGDEFNVADFDFADTARTINGSQVDHDLTITGNKKNNVIIGGDGNNTIKGDKGNDKLTGGSGYNVFVWNTGDGHDTITNYSSGDVIQVNSSLAVSAGLVGNDYVFSIGSKGSITVLNGKNKYIEIQDANGNRTWWPEDPIAALRYSSSGVTIGASYKGDSFDLEYFQDFVGKVRKIDASAVDQDIEITGDKQKNTILGGEGNDTIYGGKGNDKLTGNDGADVFVWTVGDGSDTITDYNAKDGDEIQISGGVAKVSKSGDDIILKVNGNKAFTIQNGKGQVITWTDDDGKHSYPRVVDFDGTTATLREAYEADTFNIADYPDYATKVKTIDATAVDQDIEIIGNKQKNTILGGEGNDTIYGGKGNDKLTGNDGADVFVWTVGDGSDTITDYNAKDGDEIQISGGVAKVSKSGDDIILKVGGNKAFTIQNGKGQVITWTDDDGKHSYPVVVDFDGTTATLREAYEANTFNIADYSDYATKVKTIDATAVDQDIRIIGNKQKNTILGGEGNDTIYGGKGNDKLTGNDGADVFVWNTGDGRDTITDYSAEDGDIIKINTANSNITTTASGNSLIFKVNDTKAVVVQNAANDKEQPVTFIDAEGNVSVVGGHPVIIDGKTATITETYLEDTFDLADYASKITTVDASAVTHGISIVGNKSANSILGSAQNDSISGKASADTIYGGDGNDIITGGTGNDTLTGGEGSDTFIYKSGDGNDVITDYETGDILQFTDIAAKNIKIKKANGNKDFVLTVGSGDSKGTITLKDAAVNGQVVTYVDQDGKEISYPEVVLIDEDGTTATLTENYWKDEFTASGDYSKIRTIDADAVDHALVITGSGKADKIYGTTYDDTLIGGRGGDTLTGDNGSDTFIYNDGDGNDVILNYEENDVINVVSGDISGHVKVEGYDVIFTIGSGSINVKGGKGKVITTIDKYGDVTSRVYNNSTMQATDTPWFTEDDTNFATNSDTQLSSLVQNATGYAPISQNEGLLDFSMKSDYIPAIAQSEKK